MKDTIMPNRKTVARPEAHSTPPARETRWIVLCTDGRHTTLGRHRDPDEGDITRAGTALAAAGLAGWLAVMKGGYYTRAQPELLMVRALTGEPAGWEDAARAFEAIRQEAIHPDA
jgi:hypothetical protein